MLLIICKRPLRLKLSEKNDKSECREKNKYEMSTVMVLDNGFYQYLLSYPYKTAPKVENSPVIKTYWFDENCV